jgi:ArsR family transcriptional regulator
MPRYRAGSISATLGPVVAPTVRRTKAPTEQDCATDPLCCAPLSGAALARGDAERLGRVLKALADPARLQLMSLLLAAPGGEVCVADLVPALELSQPTVSHHLRVLHDAGLLRRERRASWVWYSVVDERLDEIRTLLS